MILRVYLTILSVALLVLQGCVAVQTFPTVARAGDTVTFAVGSPDGMTKANTTVNFISDSDPLNPIDVTANLRAVTKLYPDKMSKAWFGDDASNIPANSSHGGWMTVIVLDLPSTLPLGTGHFDITVTPDVTYPNLSATVSEVQVGIEILPGTGTSNTFSSIAYSGDTIPTTGNLQLLEPEEHVLIKPPVPTSALSTYGAIEIKVNAAVRKDSDGSTVLDSDLLVVFDDQPDNLVSQRQASWVRNGDIFTINIFSPAGMYFYEARSSIVLKQDDLVSFTGIPSLSSIRYFDLSGVEITGPTPSIILNQ